MQIQYKFTSDEEPTDEQLHLLMQEVAIEVKRKAQIADVQFREHLQKLVDEALKNREPINPDAK